MSRRKLEEKIVAQLRELASLPGNKHCFDCAQRGPTYVNMTIGSFTCTSCSGILRGLNPPHRVKSISMATFTSDEYEFIKSRGNDYCRRIWLGLYDNDSRPIESGYKDESHMKDFMITKYEKKRWYVSPSEMARQQVLLDRAQSERRSTTASDTLSQGSTGSPSSVQRASAGGGSLFTQTRQQQQPPVPSLVDMSATPPAPGRPAVQSAAAAATLVDPFSSPMHASPAAAPPTLSARSDNNGFADFDSAFSGSSGFSSAGFPDALPKSQTVPANLIAPAGNTALFPPPVSGGAQFQQHPATSVAWTNGSAGGVPVAAGLRPLQPAAAGAPQQHQQAVHPPQPPPATGGDKYSALAELDGLFSSSKSSLGGGPGPSEFSSASTTVSSGMGTIFGATPLSQPVQTPTAGSVFGVTSQGVPPPSTSSFGGVFGGSVQQQTAMSKSQSAFGGFSTAPAPATHQGFPQQQQANFGVHGTAANPFMSSTPLGPQQAQWAGHPHQQQAAPANPFLAQQQYQSNPWGPQTTMTPGLVGGQGQSMGFAQQPQQGHQQQQGFMAAQSATGAVGGTNWNPFL